MTRLVLAFLLLTVKAAWAESVPLYAQIALQMHPEVQLPLSDTVTFDITTQNASRTLDALKSWPQIKATVVDQTRLSVALPAVATNQDAILPAYTSASFVVDTDEKATQQFAAGFTTPASSPIPLLSLAEYVDRYIDNPSYIHGFNIASVIASQRSGDCTEYAVLTTALARMQGLPARVVLGTVIFGDDTGVAAFGHAWSEVHDGEKWTVVDAALLNMDAPTRFYLPAGILENEGPGFAMNLMDVTVRFPSAISGLNNYHSAE